MSKPTSSKRDDRFRELLRSKGIRVTDHRLAVLHALSTRRTPASFAELVDALSPSGIDRATVYRNLLGLSEAGILIRSQLGDGVARYELPASGEATHAQHLHLVCIDCGNVSCLPANTISLRGPAAKRVTKVQLEGHCEVCAR